MLSPKQARRMAAKERRILRKAVLVLVGHLKTGAVHVLPPTAPTSTRRERGGVIIYEWKSGWLGLPATTIRALRDRHGRRYEVHRALPWRDFYAQQYSFNVEALGASLHEALTRFGKIEVPAFGKIEVPASFSYITDPASAEVFEKACRRMEVKGELWSRSATVEVHPS